MGKRKAKISTFSKVMSLKEAEAEKKKKTPTGKALREADREYRRRR